MHISGERAEEFTTIHRTKALKNHLTTESTNEICPRKIHYLSVLEKYITCSNSLRGTPANQIGAHSKKTAGAVPSIIQTEEMWH